jgi:hypothetical protein
MAVVKKTLQVQVAETEAKLAKLKAKLSGSLLDKTSPGVEKLISALDDVISQNNCKVIDAIHAISKVKKLGLKIEVPLRKAREKKVKATS